MTKKDKENSPQENSSEMDDDLDSLSQDEKAAFEKIMAQISETNLSASPGDNSANLAANEASSAGASNPEKNQNPDDSEPSKDQDLSDKQQAVQVEINSRESSQQTEPETKQDVPTTSDDENEKLSDDQQAALDKIMAEINDRESGQQTEPETAQDKEPGTHDDDAIKQKTDKEIEKLSLDEFNDELTNLLSSAQQSKKTDPKPVEEKQAPALKPESLPLKYGLAPQPSQPATADGETATEMVPAGTQAPPDESTHQGYAILQEIDATQIGKKKSKRTANQRGLWKSKSGKLVKIAAAAMVITAATGAAYWAYDRLVQSNLRIPGVTISLTTESSSAGTVRTERMTEPQPPSLSAPAGVENPGHAPQQPSPVSFGSLKSDLISARQQINNKIQEIIDLKAHYQKGIQEEQFRIRAELKIKPARSLEIAQTNNHINLSIRAIQRRMVYIAKLDTPLQRLEAASEDLLYLERRTQFFKTLNQWISGPSIPEYKQEITIRIATHLKVTTELTVDDIQIDPPSIASVWDDLQSGINKGESTVANEQKRNDQDQKINREICKGQYDRKYLLTVLSAETAQCLTQWSGKDLYLNGLTELSPQVAKILVQWPGEWLSLNGIKEISVDTAKYLSQWHGKRLSLNGLEKLSAQATAQLSRWQGEQLEMIGLTAIGRWENYATRLYLSENLRRKLQM